MRKTFLLLIAFFTAGVSLAQLNYPAAKKVNHIDDYFGTKVEDPYRWMEDLNSPELKSWIEEENKVTFSYLDKIPFRDKIRSRLNEIWNYPKYSAPFRIGNFYFFYKNDGMQNQSVLYFQKGLDGVAEVFLDPNSFSTDGTVSLSTLSGSKDGKYLVYGISRAGSDWNEFFVMDIESKTKLKDHLEWVKFSGANWLGDGFFYNRYDPPEEGQELASVNKSPKVYFHKVGTEQNEDVLVFEDKEHPEYSFSIFPSEDSRFLFLSKSRKGATGNELYFKDLMKDQSDFIPISTGFVYQIYPVNNINEDIYLLTNQDAPKNKIVKFSASDGRFTDVIPEKKDVLSGASISNGRFFVQYMVDVSDRIFIYGLDGNVIEELKLPALGTVSGYSADKEDREFFFTFTSFLYPPTIMKYDILKNELSVYKKSEVNFNPENFETKQVFYPGKDGIIIPMYIVHKKGIKLDGSNPALLYGYGGFNISLKPSFSTSNLILLENGGIYALANIRGGGEYGKEWHLAGTQLNKQNVFNDFIAAAEYLIENKYTSPAKLAIEGGSNGGLLIGAVINQHPELFKVAFPAVGVMDMLRFHKFTIGWAWVTDYGSSDDETQFKYLLGYSPYHNIKSGLDYPATMITTSDHDDRVVPSHSFKYAARLQELYKGNNPVLLRVEVNAGHGAGRPTKMIIESQVDKWSFMFYNMGITPNY